MPTDLDSHASMTPRSRGRSVQGRLGGSNSGLDTQLSREGLVPQYDLLTSRRSINLLTACF
jgi:hypothetical protein